jgi:hypothetical protein
MMRGEPRIRALRFGPTNCRSDIWPIEERVMSARHWANRSDFLLLHKQLPNPLEHRWAAVPGNHPTTSLPITVAPPRILAITPVQHRQVPALLSLQSSGPVFCFGGLWQTRRARRCRSGMWSIGSARCGGEVNVPDADVVRPASGIRRRDAPEMRSW